MRTIEPCTECGKPIERRDIKTDAPPTCMPCQRTRKRVLAEELKLRGEVDWLAVQMVCEGVRLSLTPNEKRMVIRRLESRMLLPHENGPYPPAGKLRGIDVADRLGIAVRSVERIIAELPAAEKNKCPVCREAIWVIRATAVVEAHGNAINEQCEMSGRALPAPPRGLAAVRPDLYAWLVTT